LSLRLYQNKEERKPMNYKRFNEQTKIFSKVHSKIGIPFIWFGRWSSWASAFFIMRRYYHKKYIWTPIVFVKKRYAIKK